MSSALKLVGDFSFCPNYLPGNCYHVDKIVLEEKIIGHCTKDLMCNFFVNDKLVNGYLSNNFIIKETTEFTSCIFPFYKLLHNTNNIIYVQRVYKTLYFNVLNKDLNKIYTEEIFVLISFSILSVIALLFVGYIGLDFYSKKFKASFSVTGDKINATCSICPNISSNIC